MEDPQTGDMIAAIALSGEQLMQLEHYYDNQDPILDCRIGYYFYSKGSCFTIVKDMYNHYHWIELFNINSA